jgi:hypothetical protein
MLKMSRPLAASVALALLGSAPGALAAEAKGSIYADVRWSVDWAEDNGPNLGPGTSATNNNSYYGIKASTSEGAWTAFGGYERSLLNDNKPTSSSGVAGILDFVRQGYAGMASPLGTLKYGQFATAYQQAGKKLDPF